MAIIEAVVDARAGNATVSIGGETGRLCALWSDEVATTVHLWPVGSVKDVSFEVEAPWSTATALGGTVEWPPYEYVRVAGGSLIRLEDGLDFIPDRE
jgi:hypothetical protein